MNYYMHTDEREKRMRVVSKRTLREFWGNHAQAQAPLENWHDVIASRHWRGLDDLKHFFSRSVDGVGGRRYVFNIGDNFRLIAQINFAFQVAYVKFVGTHKEYDRIKDISSI